MGIAREILKYCRRPGLIIPRLEGQVSTPTLNEVLSNRTRIIDELVANSDDAAEFEVGGRLAEEASAEEKLAEVAVEAIEIPQENK